MSDENATPDDLIGKNLGQYTILEEAGRGGMATVYKAKQTSMNRTVAIKVLPPTFLHDPSFMERFEREVEVISQLEHPHILPIFDFGKEEGMPYISMRYLGGGSMAQMIRRGVPDLEDLIRPISQVGQALDYAHMQGIIHRDLKPGNIMLDENQNAYLSDFGIARVMGSDLTGSAIIGTPAYMSPEQANGMPIDGRSDIYSLGVVLFELITGREPYQAETPMALLLKHINEPMPPARNFREGVPELVEDVLAKATAKDPDERYSSAGELSDAFRDAIRGTADTQAARPTRAKPAPPPDPATITDVPEKKDPETLEQQINRAVEERLKTGQIQPSSGMSTGVKALIGIVILAVLGGGALFVISQSTGTETDPATLVPTPFANAQTVEDDVSDYTLSVPTRFNQFRNESDPSRLYHIWEDRSQTTMVSLALPTINQNAYESRYYDPQDAYELIDEDTAPDGTLRRSYRVTDDDDLPNGQLDVFYINRNSELAVVELFTSDESEPDVSAILELQRILDSLRFATSA